MAQWDRTYCHILMKANVSWTHSRKGRRTLWSPRRCWQHSVTQHSVTQTHSIEVGGVQPWQQVVRELGEGEEVWPWQWGGKLLGEGGGGVRVTVDMFQSILQQSAVENNT